MGKATNYASFAIFLISLVLFILAFATPWWTSASVVSSGLFQSCFRITTNSDWNCDGFDLGNTGDKHKATVAMMIISLFVHVVALVMYILVLGKDFNVRLASIVMGIAGLFTLIGVSVYGSNFNGTDFIGWSFALGCTSCCVEIVGAIVTIIAEAAC